MSTTQNRTLHLFRKIAIAEGLSFLILLLIAMPLKYFADFPHAVKFVGWAHGVMNTDNMSILGLTLDYGPYAFMDDYDAGFICNHSDYNGRYAFNQQPYIGLWNLSCLAQALLPLTEKDALKAGLETYQSLYEREYVTLMRAKFGLVAEQPEGDQLIRDFLGLLHGAPSS